MKLISVSSVCALLQQCFFLWESQRRSLINGNKLPSVDWDRKVIQHYTPGLVWPCISVWGCCSWFSCLLCGDDIDRDGRGALVSDHRTAIPSVPLLQSVQLQGSCRVALFAVSAQRTNLSVMWNKIKWIKQWISVWNIVDNNSLQTRKRDDY